MPFNPKTRRYIIIFLMLGWGLSLTYLAMRQEKTIKPRGVPIRLYRDNRLLMGTFWEVVSPHKMASAIVFKEAKRIEDLLSKYIPESEISRLNRSGKLQVSPETFYIIKKSKELCRDTEGAFDITMAGLVDLWGFSEKKYRVPEEALIENALKRTGCDKIILHENDNVVEFKFPGMKVDLGGIAKGFALEQAADRLKENGINNCLINAGGQVYALGAGPQGNWKIAIQDPRKPGISKVIELKDKSAATSGDYEQFFLKDGKRYSHIINPKTGWPAETGIASVTVIDDSAAEADALSTAAFITGEEGITALKKKFPKADFLCIKENHEKH